MTELNINISNETATLTLGETLARSVQATQTGALIFLQGELGAGKTTLTRGFLRGLGYQGKVKSPSYTLVEVYELNAVSVFHFDLYRLKDPSELTAIGIEEYFQPAAICLIEWPENGATVLPVADLVCGLSICGEGRQIHVSACTEKGRRILEL